jgi:hypothetical protein
MFIYVLICHQMELERLNYDDVGHLNNALKNMQQAMKRARKKEGDIEDEEEVGVILGIWLLIKRPLQQEEPTYPLIDIPDDQVRIISKLRYRF